MTVHATPVFDRFARAWPKPDAPAAQYLPIESAFGTTWSCARPSASRRNNEVAK